MKKVLLDFDGVVYDMLDALKTVLAKQNIQFNPQNMTSYNFDGDIGCNKQDIYKQFSNVAVFKAQRMYPLAETAVYMLKSIVNVEAYTGTSKNELIIKERQRQIDKLGVVGTPLTYEDASIGNKKALIGYDALFEDSVQTMKNWFDTDTKLFLIKHNYNIEEALKYKDRLIICEDLFDAVSRYAKEFSYGF